MKRLFIIITWVSVSFSLVIAFWPWLAMVVLFFGTLLIKGFWDGGAGDMAVYGLFAFIMSVQTLAFYLLLVWLIKPMFSKFEERIQFFFSIFCSLVIALLIPLISNIIIKNSIEDFMAEDVAFNAPMPKGGIIYLNEFLNKGAFCSELCKRILVKNSYDQVFVKAVAETYTVYSFSGHSRCKDIDQNDYEAINQCVVSETSETLGGNYISYSLDWVDAPLNFKVRELIVREHDNNEVKTLYKRTQVGTRLLRYPFAFISASPFGFEVFGYNFGEGQIKKSHTYNLFF